MTKGRIIYVDEDPDDIELFQQFVDGKFDLHVIKIENDDELDAVVDEILSSPLDAVITDYLLSEKARVKFNGQVLIEAIQHRNRHIPCFLLTSHAPDALNATHDARLVQPKSIPFGGSDTREFQVIFLTQIEKVIDKFRNSYANAIREFEELTALPAETITASQRQRIIELDNYIDSHGISSHPIPSELKNDKNLELLSELIQSIDKLIGSK